MNENLHTVETLNVLELPFPTVANVRRHVVIYRPAKEAWDYIGQPIRLTEWFPGIVSVSVEGNKRQIETAAGMIFPEVIVTNDPTVMRFEYSLIIPLVVDHKSTIDVYDISENSCLVSYQATATPATLALVIAAAGGNAITNLKEILEK